MVLILIPSGICTVLYVSTTKIQAYGIKRRGMGDKLEMADTFCRPVRYFWSPVFLSIVGLFVRAGVVKLKKFCNSLEYYITLQTA